MRGWVRCWGCLALANNQRLCRGCASKPCLAKAAAPCHSVSALQVYATDVLTFMISFRPSVVVHIGEGLRVLK